MDSNHKTINNIAENTPMRIKKLLFLIIPLCTFGFIAFFSIVGRKEPSDYFLNRSIGKFEVVTYKYGLFLREKGTKNFYNISPYSIRENENSNNTILDWSMEKQALEMYPRLGSIEKKILYIESYYDLIKPSAAFLKGTNKIELKSEYPTPESTQISINSGNIISLTYNSSDFIVDNKLNAYISDSETYLEETEKFISIKLNHIPSMKAELELPKATKYLIIANPLNSGVLKVRTDNPEIEKIKLDQKNLRIEIFFKENKTPKMLLQSKDTLKEAITSYSL